MSEFAGVIQENAQEMLRLGTQMLAAEGGSARARLLAQAIAGRVSDTACVVYRVAAEDLTAWKALGKAGPVAMVTGASVATSRIARTVVEGATGSMLYLATDLAHGDLSHVQTSRPVTSVAYLLLLDADSGELAGVAEVLTFSEPLTGAELDAFEPLQVLGASALLSAEKSEQQRGYLMDSVHRMTQLYDLEKSLNATLDLDPLMALIPRKVLPMIDCAAVHLWLFTGDVLTLMASDGVDATVWVRMTQQPGEGYVADMAEEGDPLLITEAEDERLLLRNGDVEEGVRTALVVPLMQDEAEIGVIEAVNKSEGRAFDEQDQFFLTSIAETVSSALKNASLLHAERKLAILEALVHVSSQITSTLRLDRLLQIIVNSPQNVLPYERCTAVMDNRGRMQVRAISGMAAISIGDAQVDALKELVRSVPWGREPVYLRQHDDEEAEQLPNEVRKHFEETGYRGLYMMPLSDDQGPLGILLYESSQPDFLETPHTEMIKILAGQASVAIRNALLYREVPLISMLEPLMQRKQVLLRTSRGRRWGLGIGAAVLTLFFLFCPLPMRVAGDAAVAPQRLVTIAAPVDGTVAEVRAREGQRVQAGDVLGTLNDWQWHTELSAAEARYRTALLTMQADLTRGSAQAGADRAQAEYLDAERQRAQNRFRDAQLRTPITGVVVTRSLEDTAGKHLDAGAPFAQVLDLSSAVIDINISQRDAELLAPGESAVVKLDSFPQRSWRGQVKVVSPQAVAVNNARSFVARVPVANDDALLRAGMTGRAKILIGYKPAGYVLLRKPALWLWQALWSWWGW